MKNQSTNKHFLNALLLLVLLLGVNTEVWGYSSTKLVVNANGGGTVAVTTSTSAPAANAYGNSKSASQGPHGFWDTFVEDTYYIWVNHNSGYRCIGVTDGTYNNAGYYIVKVQGNMSKNDPRVKTVTATFVTDFYSKAAAHSVPSVGKVWAGVKDGQDSRSWVAPGTTDTYDWTYVAATSAPTYEYHFYKEDPDGYAFDGWYSNSGCTTLKTKAADFWQSVQATTTEITNLEYWAKFIPVTVNSVASAGTLNFTAPGNNTTTVVFNVSNADEMADFETPSVSGSGWTYVSSSYANNQVTVTVKFTATNTTTNDSHSATVTLTSKGVSGNRSKSATVVANVNLTPTLSANKTSVDFGTYTLVKDTKKTKTISLTYNANAISFEKTNDASIAPFTTSWSADHRTLTVYFEPTEEGSWEKDLTVTVRNGQTPQLSATQTIHLTGSAIRNTSTLVYNVASDYMVDAPSLDLQALWTTTSDGAKTYSIVSFTPSSANNSGLVSAPTITDNRTLSLGQAGTLVVNLHQPQTTNYYEVDQTKTITIHKYNSTYANIRDTAVLVDGNVTHPYTLTYTKPNAAYVGAANHAAAAPTLGEASGDCYYTLAHNVTTDITLGSPDASLVIAYAPGTKTITGKNQGIGTVALVQKETYKYAAATDTFRVMVSKCANDFSCSWGDWNKSLSLNSTTNVTFNTNNTNYTQCPIEISQTYGEECASMTSSSATAKSITTTDTKGYATWYLYQQENYKYIPAEADVMVMMGVPAPPTCYLVEDYTTHNFSTTIKDWEGKYDAPIAINGPADKLWFTATRQFGGVNYFVAQYTVDNGSTWRDICMPSLDYHDKDFGPYSFPGLQSGERVTHIRFGAKSGATLDKWYKNIKVSRKAYIKTENNSHEAISTLEMPVNTIGNTTQAKFYVDYSTCADTIYIESNNPHFTVNKSYFLADGDNMDQAKEEITVSYTSDVQSKDTAIISIYTGYQRRVIRVTGETHLRVQTLEWHEGYNTTPITLPVGWVVNVSTNAVTSSSGNHVTYVSGDESIIKITDDGEGFQIVGVGETTLTASAAGTNTWAPVSETRTVVATDKIIQEITWNQAFPRYMEIADEIDLEAVVYLFSQADGTRTYSAERTAALTYSAPWQNGVITVSGKTMKVVGYGTTTITANVAGNEDYEAAAPVTMSITVRQPSTGCETPLVLDHAATVTLFREDFDFTDWTTPELQSDIIELSAANGTPDKLSFKYSGAEYKAPVIGTKHFGGYVKAQQRIGLTWSDVTGSRVSPVKNEWHALENLQLDENANAIRFIRENGGTGYHYFNDIQVTLRQYLRASSAVIDLGDVKVGETRNDVVGIDYSDVKTDLRATVLDDEDTWLTIANNGFIDSDCGSHAHYNIPIIFIPMEIGEWKDTIVVVDDIANLEIRIPIQANVIAGDDFIYEAEGTWGTSDNWNTKILPGSGANVIIDANVEITTAVHVYSMTINDGYTVKIMPSGGLTVGAGGIDGATKDNLILKAGTEGATKGQTGYFRISPEYTGEMPEATVELFSIGYYNRADARENVAAWQYIGAPIDCNGVMAKNYFTRSWVYGYKEDTDEWVNKLKTLVMEPFVGYATTQTRDVNGMLISFDGKLHDNHAVETIDLAYTDTEHGHNIVANSYTAPIDITKFEDSDFVNVEKNVYIFNTGSRTDAEALADTKSADVNAAGQYLTIPIGTAREMKAAFGTPTVIAPMQGFFVKAVGANAQIKFNYEKLVWNSNYASHIIGPLRSRANIEDEASESESEESAEAETELAGTMQLVLTAGGWHDNLFILEADKYGEGYENGYDARKMREGEFNIFAVEEDEIQLAVDATNSIIGTRVGVRTGEETAYTLMFTHLRSEEDLALLDIETNQTIDINEGTEYTFFAEPNTVIPDRFRIVERNNAPEIATDVDNVSGETKVHKFIKNDRMYILKNGVLYNATGAVVR